MINGPEKLYPKHSFLSTSCLVMLKKIPNRRRPHDKASIMALALAAIAAPGTPAMVDGHRVYRWRTGDTSQALVVNRLIAAGKLVLRDGGAWPA